MKLKQVELTNFRRFTKLRIQNIPDTTRLIMLAGPNGCGKSSFFDALSIWYQLHSGKSFNWQVNYHVKQSKLINMNSQNNSDSIIVVFHEEYLTDDVKKSIYVRSAYRNDPELDTRRKYNLGKLLDDKQNSLLIYNDQTVSKNYERLIGNAVEELFSGQGNGRKTRDEMLNDLIGPVRDKFHMLFSDIELVSLGNPNQKSTFLFNKGSSSDFEYLNLSGGEKAAFDLILDLFISLQEFDNTIFCIDEPESHINPRVQSNLLSVIYSLIPENCQLILATHSIGMMRRAQEIEKNCPGSVVFLDFELNFDQPQIVEPIVPDRPFWNRAYEVALDDIAALVAPQTVVICVGEPISPKKFKNQSHDAHCYGVIFQKEYPETQFVSAGNDKNVEQDKLGLVCTLRQIVSGIEIIGNYIE